MSSRKIVTAGTIVVSILSATAVSAWTGPSASPPGGNVAAPINVGSTNQIKNASIGVNGISVFGNSVLSGLGVGTGRYLNFDYTSGGTSGAGLSGYGIRDNNGTLEFKNSGGTWASLQSLIFAGGSQWATGTGGAIYYNGGNVGIGTPTPEATLHVMRGTAPGGTAIFSGTTNLSHFNWSVSEDTYIRGGKSTSRVIINDTASGNVLIAEGGGNVGIGTAAPQQKLDVLGTAAVDYLRIDPQDGTNEGGEIQLVGSGSYGAFQFDNYQGHARIHTLGSGKYFEVIGGSGIRANAFLYSSDKRLKGMIWPLRDGLTKVSALNPVSFTWKDGMESGMGGKEDIGFIAQEVEAIVPEVVHTDENGMKSID